MPGKHISRPLTFNEVPEQFTTDSSVSNDPSSEKILRKPGNFILYPISRKDPSSREGKLNYAVTYMRSFNLTPEGKFTNTLLPNDNNIFATFEIQYSDFQKFEFNISALLEYIDSGLKYLVGMDETLVTFEQDSLAKQTINALHKKNKVMLFVLEDPILSQKKSTHTLPTYSRKRFVEDGFRAAMLGMYQGLERAVNKDNYLILDLKKPLIAFTELHWVTNVEHIAQQVIFSGIFATLAQDGNNFHLTELQRQFDLKLEPTKQKVSSSLFSSAGGGPSDETPLLLKNGDESSKRRCSPCCCVQ